MEFSKTAVESVVVTLSFWQGKKVFITGHTGFKGSWLSLWLQELGAEIIGFSLNFPTGQNLFSQARVGERMVNIYGDVRDNESLHNAIQSHRPDIIFHLAAQSLVRKSYDDPVGTFATNVMGTVYLLDALRHVDSVRVVINVTSDKCYENKEWVWGYRENDSLGGYDPYSCSKACSELITSAYRNSYFNPKYKIALATARAGNVIGGGDWAEDRLIPDIMRSIISRKLAIIRNPQAIRPWQHVLDALNGYLMLAEKLWYNPDLYSEGWNFGPSGDAITVELLTQRVIELWGDGAPQYSCNNGVRPHETNYLKLDSSKARQKLGWRTKLTIADALKWTVEWYLACAKGQDLQSITLNQIQCFEKLCKEAI